MAIRSYITRILPQVPERYFVMNISDIVLTFIGIVNIFVLYLCSKDYRRIINKFISTTSSTTRVVSLQDNYVK
uniref:G_PROTEIN_RECEP_F1_2 domain-containing protein n=1 Tax=Meloidogyne hapla TaxID=6305 RepID=A0A1I8BHP3_MELHA